MSFVSYNESIAVNLIRQWCFCPRIVYYRELMNLVVKDPLWLDQGSKLHLTIEKLERRRNFSKYNIKKGKKYFNFKMSDDNLNIHGIADLVIESEEKIYIIEYKTNPKPKNLGHQLQLCAYSLLAESYFNKKCNISFLSDGKKLYKINITNVIKDKLMEIISKIRYSLSQSIKPESSATNLQCSQCEYINFCNDRL